MKRRSFLASLLLAPFIPKALRMAAPARIERIPYLKALSPSHFVNSGWVATTQTGTNAHTITYNIAGS